MRVAAARAGRYPRGMVDGALELGSITLDDVRRMFPDYGEPSDWLLASKALRSRIAWSLLDLTTDPYPRADVVLCRNVLHMIAGSDRANVVDRFAATGRPVVAGKSDRLHMDAYWRERFAETPTAPLILRPVSRTGSGHPCARRVVHFGYLRRRSSRSVLIAFVRACSTILRISGSLASVISHPEVTHSRASRT